MTDTHTWWMPGTINSDGTWVFERGWMVEDEGDHFEVYYATHEAMRLGADGSLHIGKPAPYIFKTREWAQLCADRLNSLDRAFDRPPANTVLYSSGNVGVGTTSPQYKFHISSGPTPIVTMDQNHTLTYVNVPYIVKVWLRSTAVWRGLKRLWYGERYDN